MTKIFVKLAKFGGMGLAALLVWFMVMGGIPMVFGLFVMGAACYLLFITSDPLEEVGGRIGKLLHLPDDVIASTFQALATSGPEIVMAVLAATAYIEASSSWAILTTGERGCSGCLNMCFSAMDNLLGIGCVGMIFMMVKGFLKSDEVVIVSPSVKAGLLFYIVSSSCLCAFLQLSSHTIVLESGREIVGHTLNVWQSWVLMGIGIAFVGQFFLPVLRRFPGLGWLPPSLPDLWQARHEKRVAAGLEPEVEEEEDDDDDENPVPLFREEPIAWLKDFGGSGFVYAFLVFGLIVFVRECMGATFNMAAVGIVSVGGVLLMFTSYVSSFPEFMMTYRFAAANNKNALLGMLFGSNVIDLAFAGFRSIKTGVPMEVYTTGRMQQLFPVYLWCLPALAIVALAALSFRKFKYGHSYLLVVLYLIYIISGFILL
jgi:Ca2+/Na+ antiporter